MDSPGNFPTQTATQNHHDDHPKSKLYATNTNNFNNPNENIVFVNKTISTNPTTKSTKINFLPSYV